MSLQYDITIPRGISWSMTVAYTDDSETPISLSGYTATAQLREYPEASDGFAITCSCGSTGISMTLAAATTKLIPWSIGTWDLFLTSPENIIEKVLEGRVFIGEDTTR